MYTSTHPTHETWLNRRCIWRLTPAHLFLILLILFSAGLHVYHLQEIGDANTYYAAAVKSMLQSWHNFFFVAAEPGGSVSVDKPPLGLWIEAAFAALLGVNGVALSLPNILAGLFSIPLIYHLVKQLADTLAGLLAALVMTLTPIFLATNRNNTMDGMLVFTLLLAAWAFLHATRTGKLRWLLLGGLWVGLGFNIKMLQALLPLPAFVALYFFGARQSIGRKIWYLALTGLLVGVVSFAWVAAVDLTPADQRPYVGSSDNNTVLDLILGHNGISRLESGVQQRAQADPAADSLPADRPDGPAQARDDGRGVPPAALQACQQASTGDVCQFSLPNSQTIEGICVLPPNLQQLACAPQGAAIPPAQIENPAGGTPFSQETGQPGVLRFFTDPLSKQMSWLLPFALISLGLAASRSRLQWPLTAASQRFVLLWGGWLLTCLVFFSAVSGIFHAYYTLMLVPPLAALVGWGVSAMAKAWQHGWMPRVWIALSVLLTVAFQVYSSLQYESATVWVWGSLGILLMGLLASSLRGRGGYLLLILSMLLMPAYWTLKTVMINANANLPTAYSGTQPADRLAGPQARENGTQDTALMDYLQAHTQGMQYLAAVPSSNQMGAELVLASGRPVLYMGGFNGSDPVIDADGLQELVAAGDLRFVLAGDLRGDNGEIRQWLQQSCQVLTQFSRTEPGPSNAPGGRDRTQGSAVWYDCQ